MLKSYGTFFFSFKKSTELSWFFLWQKERAFATACRILLLLLLFALTVLTADLCHMCYNMLCAAIIYNSWWWHNSRIWNWPNEQVKKMRSIFMLALNFNQFERKQTIHMWKINTVELNWKKKRKKSDGQRKKRYKSKHVFLSVCAFTKREYPSLSARCTHIPRVLYACSARTDCFIAQWNKLSMQIIRCKRCVRYS